MGPLQDPRLRIHVSTSSYLRFLCKIHVFRFMSQHLRISGSSARSMSPIHVLASTNMDPLQDPRLRIHVSTSSYLRFLCKIHVSGFMSPIHVLASTNFDPLQDPRLRIHVSTSSYLRLLCKIHVSGFMSPIHVLASTQILYKIHVFGFMSQHLCISGSPARPMSRNPCLSNHM